MVIKLDLKTIMGCTGAMQIAVVRLSPVIEPVIKAVGVKTNQHRPPRSQGLKQLLQSPCDGTGQFSFFSEHNFYYHNIL